MQHNPDFSEQKPPYKVNFKKKFHDYQIILFTYNMDTGHEVHIKKKLRIFDRVIDKQSRDLS